MTGIADEFTKDSQVIKDDTVKPIKKAKEDIVEVDDHIADINAKRKTAVEAVLALCLIFTIIQVAINSADVFCKRGSKPNQTLICGQYCRT